MKKTLLVAALGLLICSPALAQDIPVTGIGYIPGMPVPVAQTAPASSEPAASPGAGKSDGKIAKVSVGGANHAPTPQPQSSAPANHNNSQQSKANRDEYRGVTPPKRLKPENESTFTKTSDNQLSWIGFMPEDSSHRVFLQTSRSTPFERIASSQDRVEILLANTKLAVSNNERELNMKYFHSPFSRAYAKSEGKNVRVVIEFKENVPVTVQQQDNIINISASASSPK